MHFSFTRPHTPFEHYENYALWGRIPAHLQWSFDLYAINSFKKSCHRRNNRFFIYWAGPGNL